MAHRLRWFEPVALLCVAGTLLSAAAFSFHVKLLKTLISGLPWSQQSEAVRVACWVYGFVILLAALASGRSIKRLGLTFVERFGLFSRATVFEVRDVFRWITEGGDLRKVAAWMAGLLVVGMAARGYFLLLPIRYDEAYTFLTFVNREFWMLFYYPAPNNHLLHTLLVQAAVGLFGDNVVAIRLPALIAGMLAIPTVFAAARVLVGKNAGYVASSAMAVFPFVIAYDITARGYSLKILFSLWALIWGLRYVTRPSREACFILALTGAFGALVMPTFIFPFTGICLWVVLLLQGGGESRYGAVRRFVVACGCLTGALTLLLYTFPILVNGGIVRFLNSATVKARPWADFVSAVPRHVVESGHDLFVGVPVAVTLGIIGLAVLGVSSAPEGRRRVLLLLVPALVASAALILVVKRSIPFARTWSYMLPVLFILADAGVIAIRSRVTRSVSLSLRAGCLALATGSALLLIRYDVLPGLVGGGNFPEAPVVAEYLAQEIGDTDDLHALPPADYPVYYYLAKQGVSWARFVEPRTIDAGTRLFFVVRTVSHRIELYSPEKARRLTNASKLMEHRNAVVYLSEPVANPR